MNKADDVEALLTWSEIPRDQPLQKCVTCGNTTRQLILGIPTCGYCDRRFHDWYYANRQRPIELTEDKHS
jgi:hypothetical protein